MNMPRVVILRTAGTNCDRETQHAFERLDAHVDLIHINRLLETPVALHAYQVLVIPGGFTYGDDLGAGKILSLELRYKLADHLVRFVQDGNLVLGICNGFQVLVKAGLLPGFTLPFSREKKRGTSVRRGRPGRPARASSARGGAGGATALAAWPQEATLTGNDSGRFEARWIRLKVSSDKSEFLKGGTSLYLPVAHGEGKFVPASPLVRDQLRDSGQVVLRYAGPEGGPAGYPGNPNGSVDDIAGVCDPTGRILGLMPHPERFADPTHHPRWTREGLVESPDGLLIFENAVRYAKTKL
ncbi:MAG: phosphoribosylformylglycinamidine synthase I [Planctomycetes bacterium]|nr:phosphoribosylformylglycinamidine synthase I [Planctomycetota bacterium]